jgi:hypothetical protein
VRSVCHFTDNDYFYMVRKVLSFTAMALFAGIPRIFAQGCVVCSNTAQSLDDKGARGLNGGIIYLAFLPLTIMITLGVLWWRVNKKNI